MKATALVIPLLALASCHHYTRTDATPPALTAYRDAYNAHDIGALVMAYAPERREEAARGTLAQHACTKVTFERAEFGTSCTRGGERGVWCNQTIDTSYVADVDGLILEGRARFELNADGLIERETIIDQRVVARHSREYPFAHLTDDDAEHLRFRRWAQGADVATTAIGIGVCGFAEANPIGAWAVPLKVLLEYGRARAADRDRRECKNPFPYARAEKIVTAAPAVLNAGSILAWCF